MENTKGRGALKWALSIGIIIVLNLFFWVAIETVYPEPDYTNFCVQEQVNREFTDETSCVAAGGQWNEFSGPKTPTEPEQTGWCNPDFTCAQAYNDAHKNYTRNIFVTLIVLGALSLGAGFALQASSAVSAGLSYGGVLSFVIASIRYWGEAGDIIRLVIVAIALVILIGIGIRKFKD